MNPGPNSMRLAAARPTPLPQALTAAGQTLATTTLTHKKADAPSKKNMFIMSFGIYVFACLSYLRLTCRLFASEYVNDSDDDMLLKYVPCAFA